MSNARLTHKELVHRWYINNKQSNHRRALKWVKNHPEWRSYNAARTRCKYPSQPGYKNYGGRGIKFLYKSFTEFLQDVGYKPTIKHTIDRINVDGHYEPGNCRWATRQEQIDHRRPLTCFHKRDLYGRFTSEVYRI